MRAKDLIEQEFKKYPTPEERIAFAEGVRFAHIPRSGCCCALLSADADPMCSECREHCDVVFAGEGK